jgi:enamine deaminase RidA (YjgF/YER057c/UK114 family)
MQAPATESLDDASPEERLRALGIELPPAAPAVGDYAPAIITGNLLMTSGQLPWIAGDLKFKGKIGAELSIEQGYQAFRLSALNAIAQVRKALGSLDRVRQIVRLEGTLGCAAGFADQPSVLDGASHIVNEVFGPRGHHTRWSIPITPCRWIAPLWLCCSPRSPPAARRRRIGARIRASAPRCGRNGS